MKKLNLIILITIKYVIVRNFDFQVLNKNEFIKCNKNNKNKNCKSKISLVFTLTSKIQKLNKLIITGLPKSSKLNWKEMHYDLIWTKNQHNQQNNIWRIQSPLKIQIKISPATINYKIHNTKV